MQEQAESIGQEAVAAQPGSAEAILEFLDAVFAFSAFVVEGEDLGATDQKAQVGSRRGVLGLVAEAALVRPTAGAMTEAGKARLRHLRTAIAMP